MTNWLYAEFIGGGQPLKKGLSGPAYGVTSQLNWASHRARRTYGGY